MKHPYRWLIATFLLALAVQPVLLPHPLWVQIVIGGAAGAQGYALAALGGFLTRRLPSRLTSRWALPVPKPALTVALGAAGVAVATVTAHAGQVAASVRTGMPAPTFLADALAIGGAVLAGIAVIGIGIGVRIAAGAAGRALHRTSGRVAALLLAPVLVLTGSNAAAAAGPPAPAENSSATSAENSSATSAENSSATSAAGLGSEGAGFLAARPDAAAIRAVTGRPAQTPIRVYVGRAAAASAQRRADIAVTELERAGGFRRAAVLINVPTGSGWVNPASGAALEYLYGGDLATVVVQYAAAPSWMAYLRGGEGVQASTRALTDALRARLNRIPLEHRPRLLVYGESLGAWGGLRAYDVDSRPGPDGGRGLGISQRVDGALWAGIPGAIPAQPPAGTRTFVHRDDPVPAWGLPLMLHQSSVWPGRWLPITTFWQATGDVIAATGVPPGHGHRYGPELVDAWRSVISTAGLPSAAPPDRLSAVRLALG